MSPAIGQRVWNTQPVGGVKGDGISPRSARGARVPLDPRIRDRRRIQQRLGIGMQRALIDLVAIRELHDAPEIHHRHTVGDMAHHREIVRDEQDKSARAVPADPPSRLMIWPWIETSSAETGSSQTMKLGSSASARAIPTR